MAALIAQGLQWVHPKDTSATEVGSTHRVRLPFADMLKHVCKGAWMCVMLVRKEIHRTRAPEKWLAGLIETL